MQVELHDSLIKLSSFFVVGQVQLAVHSPPHFSPLDHDMLKAIPARQTPDSNASMSQPVLLPCAFWSSASNRGIPLDSSPSERTP